ncbi:Sec-independent protein translocase protein TatB [Salinicola sp. DM10]|uniref:Sec-independent protein translocase protein TatB n=1 Tax=Salinicola sp. DM10 TaxID=2815721 RepID=UPI001A8E0907|nr:Sec-independent protein translocase protein TatB [Salinicola sp. DM10]MCE3026795.1 Sec-independent protein translocase protein TatB [Salinicola sp. DM10]
MFDIGFFELLLIGIVGLLVLGPERLPIAARTAGLWIGRIRRSVTNMQREITSQLEAEELRQKLAEQQRKLDEGVGRVRQEVEQGQRQLDEGVGRARHAVEKSLDSGTAHRSSDEARPGTALATATDSTPADAAMPPADSPRPADPSPPAADEPHPPASGTEDKDSSSR